MIEISQERKKGKEKKNSWHTRLKLPFQTVGSAQRGTNSNRPKKEERKTKEQWVYLQPSATYLIDDYFYIISFVGWWWLSFHTLWATRIRKKIAIIGHLTLCVSRSELMYILISLTGRLASFHLAQFSHIGSKLNRRTDNAQITPWKVVDDIHRNHLSKVSLNSRWLVSDFLSGGGWT